MGNTLQVAVNNLQDLVNSGHVVFPTAIYSNFNISSWALPSFPSVPSVNQDSVHVLLWNTDCLFCSWFQPINSWTVPSVTVSGGRRKRRAGRSGPRPASRPAPRPGLHTFHSLPRTEGVSGAYSSYYYQPALPRPGRLSQRKRSEDPAWDKATVRTLNSVLKLVLRLLELWAAL